MVNLEQSAIFVFFCFFFSASSAYCRFRAILFEAQQEEGTDSWSILLLLLKEDFRNPLRLGGVGVGVSRLFSSESFPSEDWYSFRYTPNVVETIPTINGTVFIRTSAAVESTFGQAAWISAVYMYEYNSASRATAM